MEGTERERRINPQERNTLRSDVRSMYAASQLSGGRSTDVDDAPQHLHVNQKHDGDERATMYIINSICQLSRHFHPVCAERVVTYLVISIARYCLINPIA